jgi:hypothetical protein
MNVYPPVGSVIGERERAIGSGLHMHMHMRTP